MSSENTLRYLKTDYQSHKNALLQRVRARYPKFWNDFLANSFGIVLVDIIAWSTATLAFLINRMAGENFIPTMTLRESAVNIGALTGYQLRGPSPAVVSCEATLLSAEAATVQIKSGTMIRTSDANTLPFEVVQNYTIAIGRLTPETMVLSIDSGLTGADTVSTKVTVLKGSVYADLQDTTIDLSQLIQAGQTFRQTDTTTGYSVLSIEAAPGAVSNNRIVLATAWTGSSGSIAAEVYDRRIQLSQGQTIEDRFSSPESQSLNFVVKLSTTPAIQNSIAVTVNGLAWTQVSSLAGSAAEDEVYQVKTLSTGETLVLFGDGTFGSVIPTEALIAVTYRVGGGAVGNIALNTINTSISGLIVSTSNTVTIMLKNSTSEGMGGRDAETLEEARVNIPYSTRTNDRAVTLADYQTIAQNYSDPVLGSVAFARSGIRTENSLLEGNMVVIYAWTTGSGGGLVNLSPQLKQSLQDYMLTKALGTDYVMITDGTARPVPVSLRFQTLAGYTVADTQSLIQDTISSRISALRPGDPLIYSDLVAALDAVTGVDNLEMAAPTQDLYPSLPTELFTDPDETYQYSLDKTGSGVPVSSSTDGATIGLYIAQMPVFPLQAWSFRLYLGSSEITVMPGLNPGYAQLYSTNLSLNETKDDNNNLTYASTVNLLTGQIRLWIKGAPGDLKMELIPISGYSSLRSVNLYVSYSGTDSQTKRREIRSSLQAWGNGLPVGGTMYASEISGITPSKSSVATVAGAVPGVTAVNRVALDTPNGSADRISALSEERLRVGSVIINNQVD